MAESGGISQAAEQLGLTQPNLSRQIKMLEEEWGWKLFQRSGRGVQLTAKGEVSYREMKKVQRVLGQSLKSMHRENGVKRLRVGYAPSLASSFLRQVIRRYRECTPQVQISLHDVSTEEMRTGIEKGELDAVVGVEFDNESIQWYPLYEVPQMVICPVGHRLTRLRSVSSRDLDQERLLMFSRLDYPQYWENILSYYSEKGINAKVAGEFDGVESLLTALRAGLGIALLSENIVHQLDAEMVAFPLSDGIPNLQVSIGVASYHSPEYYVQDFLTLACE